MRLNPPAEMWKGLSDIPLVILTAVFAFSLKKKKNGYTDWTKMMLLSAFSAAGGVIVHVFHFDEPWISIFWCAEYFLLYELVRKAAVLITGSVSAERNEKDRYIPILEGVLFLSACLIRFLIPGKDIYLLVLFAAVMLFKLLKALKKAETIPQELKRIPLIIIPVVILQATAEKFPAAVVIEHLFLAAGLYFIYRLGIRAPETAA